MNIISSKIYFQLASHVTESSCILNLEWIIQVRISLASSLVSIIFSFVLLILQALSRLLLSPLVIDIEWFLPCFCAPELILGIMKNAFVSHKMDSKIFGSCSACQFSSAIGELQEDTISLWFSVDRRSVTGVLYERLWVRTNITRVVSCMLWLLQWHLWFGWKFDASWTHQADWYWVLFIFFPGFLLKSLIRRKDTAGDHLISSPAALATTMAQFDALSMKIPKYLLCWNVLGTDAWRLVFPI